MGAALVSHPLVRHVSFTGSVATGQDVLHRAAAKVMPSNLELGGNSPTIVMPDANLEAASRAGALAVVRNSGQSCFATTRLLVHRSVHDEFVDLLAQGLSGLTLGHTLDDADLGPLASQRQLDRVTDFVADARIAVGGNRPEEGGDGFFYEPTMLVDVTNDMMPLYPGDVISTGTPGAVHIRAGDVAECRIDGIGTLRNPAVAGEPDPEA